MTIRGDGSVLFYRIQHKVSDDPDGTERWVNSSHDHFGYPTGFNASGVCWQRTGIHGTFDDIEARNGLTWMRERNATMAFRAVKVMVHQKTFAMPW